MSHVAAPMDPSMGESLKMIVHLFVIPFALYFLIGASAVGGYLIFAASIYLFIVTHKRAMFLFSVNMAAAIAGTVSIASIFGS